MPLLRQLWFDVEQKQTIRETQQNTVASVNRIDTIPDLLLVRSLPFHLND